MKNIRVSYYHRKTKTRSRISSPLMRAMVLEMTFLLPLYMHKVEIAGLRLEFDSRYPSLMKEAFAEYSCAVADAAALKLNPDQWIEHITSETEQEPKQVEFYALSVALGELLPLHNRLQTHGVAIEYDGKAYIFSAPSGTGKSTRAFLWQKYLGQERVTVINGDKPILWFRKGSILACGSPWAGKEGLHKNTCVPLGGICLLRRSPQNTIRRASAKEFFNSYYGQVQMPIDPQALLSALSLLEGLYSKVPVFILENDMSEQGVKVAFEALTGETYETHRI